MEQLTALSLGRKLVLAAAALLLIDTFLPWQKIDVKVAGIVSVSASANGWHGFWGFILGLATVALLAWAAARMFGRTISGVPDGLTTLALGGVILVCALLKNLTDDYSAWASYLGILLAAGVAYGAWLTFQESGEKLPEFSTGTTNA